MRVVLLLMHLPTSLADQLCSLGATVWVDSNETHDKKLEVDKTG